MRTDLYRAKVQGRWPSILPQLGIPREFLNRKNQPCPICGGKDRARFTNLDGNGTYWCTHCGTGDGVRLVMLKNGWDFMEARKRIDPLIGNAPIERPRVERSEAGRRRELNSMWAEAKPITIDDPAGKYLHRRCGITKFPAYLRYAKSLRHYEEKRSFPGMLAKVLGPDGLPATLHRTYLTTEGEKAPIEKPRMLMPGAVPNGAAVRLATAGETLGIAEGIETAISASILHGLPMWAVLSTVGMVHWTEPEGVTKVVICGDNDLEYAGQAAAYTAAVRLSRRVAVEVRIPGHQTTGADWNDMIWGDANNAAALRASDVRTTVENASPSLDAPRFASSASPARR